MSKLINEFTKLKQLEASAKTDRNYWRKRRRFMERLLIDRERYKKLLGWYDFVKGSLSEDERNDFKEITKR